MFRHVVMMKLSEQAADKDAAAIVDSLRSLPAVVPEIRAFSVGLDAGVSEGNFDLVVVVDFDDVEGYHAYSVNAEHQTVVAERIRPFLAGRSAVQYTID